MKQVTEGPFKQTFSLDGRTGRFLKEELPPVPLFHETRRFSCVFLSSSAKDAASLNQHLSAAGIRAYHAVDTRDAGLLSAITSADILLIDIDRTVEPWREVLQRLDRSRPASPKVVLTARDGDTWRQILSRFALDIVPKPVHLGELLGALEHAHLVTRELSDPKRAHIREMRVMAAIRTASQTRTSKHIQPDSQKAGPHSIRARLSAMMNRVTHVWCRSGRPWTRKQDSHA